MSDLIYVDYNDAKADLQVAFPDAIIDDASDFVHQYRLEISGNLAESYHDYYMKIAKMGIVLYSLAFRLACKAEQEAVVADFLAWKEKGGE